MSAPFSPPIRTMSAPTCPGAPLRISKKQKIYKSNLKRFNAIIINPRKLIITEHQPWNISGQFIGDFECDSIPKCKGPVECNCPYPDFYIKELKRLDNEELMLDEDDQELVNIERTVTIRKNLNKLKIKTNKLFKQLEKIKEECIPG